MLNQNSPKPAVTVLLVDDHPILRSGLRQIIAQQPHLRLAGEASSIQAALQSARELAPDVVVMDVHLADGNGIEATRQLLALCPATKVVMFSADPDRALVNAALQAGASGYILKRSAADELLQAIDQARAGRLYLSPEISADLLEAYRQSLSSPTTSAAAQLSQRELELLRLIAEGRRNKEIAVQLGLSVKSVEAYRSRLMKKLACSSSAELVRFAIREGIAPP